MRQNTTLGKLQKKLAKLERKFEKTNEKAILDRERIMRSAQRVQEQIAIVRVLLGQGFANPTKEVNDEARTE